MEAITTRKQRPDLRGGTNTPVPVIPVPTQTPTPTPTPTGNPNAPKVTPSSVADETELDVESELQVLTKSALMEFVVELQKNNASLIAEAIKQTVEALKPVPTVAAASVVATAPTVVTAPVSAAEVKPSENNNPAELIDKVTVSIVALVYLVMLSGLVLQHVFFEKTLLATLLGIGLITILGTVRGSVIQKVARGDLIGVLHVAGITCLLLVVGLQKSLVEWWSPTALLIMAIGLPSLSTVGCVVLWSFGKKK